MAASVRSSTGIRSPCPALRCPTCCPRSGSLLSSPSSPSSSSWRVLAAPSRQTKGCRAGGTGIQQPRAAAPMLWGPRGPAASPRGTTEQLRAGSVAAEGHGLGWSCASTQSRPMPTICLLLPRSNIMSLFTRPQIGQKEPI